MAVPIQLTVDCTDPARLVRFWSQALDYQPEPPPDGFADWLSYWRDVGVDPDEFGPDDDGCDSIVDPQGRGPRIWFQKVPETKQLKNRLHLDLRVTGGRSTPLDERRRLVRAAAEKLCAAGARQLRELSEDGLDHAGIVLGDPEGNEFCLH